MSVKTRRTEAGRVIRAPIASVRHRPRRGCALTRPGLQVTLGGRPRRSQAPLGQRIARYCSRLRDRFGWLGIRWRCRVCTFWLACGISGTRRRSAEMECQSEDVDKPKTCISCHDEKAALRLCLALDPSSTKGRSRPPTTACPFSKPNPRMERRKDRASGPTRRSSGARG